MAFVAWLLIVTEALLIVPGFALSSSSISLRRVQRNVAPLSTRADSCPDCETRAALRDVFCFAIAGLWDQTTSLAMQQMKGCGSYTVFSNYSDPASNITKLFTDDMRVETNSKGWAALSPMVLKAWQHIATTSWPDQFRWFVKLEPDTFFRPRFLPRILAHYDSEVPIGFASGGANLNIRFRGSMEVVSHKVFRHSKSALFLRSQGEEEPGADDTWLTQRFGEVGFKVFNGSEVSNCEVLCVSYFNAPDGYIDSSHRNVLPAILNARPSLLNGQCLDREIVSIHPVKDVSVYKQFQSLDKALMKTEQLRDSDSRKRL